MTACSSFWSLLVMLAMPSSSLEVPQAPAQRKRSTRVVFKRGGMDLYRSTKAVATTTTLRSSLSNPSAKSRSPPPTSATVWAVVFMVAIFALVQPTAKLADSTAWGTAAAPDVVQHDLNGQCDASGLKALVPFAPAPWASVSAPSAAPSTRPFLHQPTSTMVPRFTVGTLPPNATHPGSLVAGHHASVLSLPAGGISPSPAPPPPAPATTPPPSSPPTAAPPTPPSGPSPAPPPSSLSAPPLDPLSGTASTGSPDSALQAVIDANSSSTLAEADARRQVAISTPASASIHPEQQQQQQRSAVWSLATARRSIIHWTQRAYGSVCEWLSTHLVQRMPLPTRLALTHVPSAAPPTNDSDLSGQMSNSSGISSPTLVVSGAPSSSTVTAPAALTMTCGLHQCGLWEALAPHVAPLSSSAAAASARPASASAPPASAFAAAEVVQGSAAAATPAAPSHALGRSREALQAWWRAACQAASSAAASTQRRVPTLDRRFAVRVALVLAALVFGVVIEQWLQARAQQKAVAEEAGRQCERNALKMERDAALQQQDALMQERDTLQQARDALQQERDTLQQERDQAQAAAALHEAKNTQLAGSLKQAKNRAVRNTRTIKACVVSCVALSCMADGLKEQLALRDSMCSTRTAQLRALRKRSAAQRVKSSALRAALTTQQQLTALAKSEMAVVREQALEREEKAKVLEETMASDQALILSAAVGEVKEQLTASNDRAAQLAEQMVAYQAEVEVLKVQLAEQSAELTAQAAGKRELAGCSSVLLNRLMALEDTARTRAEEKEVLEASLAESRSELAVEKAAGVKRCKALQFDLHMACAENSLLLLAAKPATAKPAAAKPAAAKPPHCPSNSHAR